MARQTDAVPLSLPFECPRMMKYYRAAKGENVMTHCTETSAFDFVVKKLQILLVSTPGTVEAHFDDVKETDRFRLYRMLR